LGREEMRIEGVMEGRERMNPSVKRKCKKEEEKEEFEAAQEKLALMIQMALRRSITTTPPSRVTSGVAAPASRIRKRREGHRPTLGNCSLGDDST
jgi:hypothetical protein